MRLTALFYGLIAALGVALVFGGIAFIVSGVMVALAIGIPVLIILAALFGKVEIIKR